MRFCEECGAQLEDGVKFCEECGAEVEDLVIDEVPVEKTDIEEPEETENMVQPAVQNEKPVSKSKSVKSGKPMKKGLLFGIIGAVVAIILAVVFIFVLGGDKEDSGSKKKSDKQVEEDISVKDAEEKEEAVGKQDADDDENKANSAGNSAVEDQEEKVSIFDVGFGGEFSGGTYTVECDDGFGMWLNYSPMGSGGYIHSADWSRFTYFDFYEDICFNTEYSFSVEGTNEYGVWYIEEIIFTVQKDGIWLYWWYYAGNQVESVLYDGFISSENVTCTSSYTEYEWGLKAISGTKNSIADRDSRYISKRIVGGETTEVSYYGTDGDNAINLTQWEGYGTPYYINIYSDDWAWIGFGIDGPIYYDEEFVYLCEWVYEPESEGYCVELDYTIQSNGEKVYDTSKYDDYAEVRILVNDAGIDVYWCDHSKSGITVHYDGLFEAELVERTTDIKNY